MASPICKLIYITYVDIHFKNNLDKVICFTGNRNRQQANRSSIKKATTINVI